MKCPWKMKFSIGLNMMFFIYLMNTPSLFSQVSSTQTSIGIDAVVAAPITLENTNNTPLDFGTISRSSVQGTVIVSTNGSRTKSGGVELVGTLSSSAPFAVSGEGSTAFVITLPPDGNTKLYFGAEWMAVNSFVHDLGLNPTLSLAGTASFKVGATLVVGANQVVGNYSGSFDVTVAYQ